MVSQQSVMLVGIIGGAVGLLLFAGGVLLLVLSIISTVKGKRRIGGIVGGGIMLIGGISVGFTFGMFAVTAGLISSSSADTAQIAAMTSHIQSALNDNDADALYELFSEESYSGEPLEYEDAEEICDYIKGDVKNVTFEPMSISVENGTHATEYKYTIVTEDGDKYTLYIHVIEVSDTEEYVGIQHIKMYKGMRVLCNVGTAPVFD
jgi:hypothetical protein